MFRRGGRRRRVVRGCRGGRSLNRDVERRSELTDLREIRVRLDN